MSHFLVVGVLLGLVALRVLVIGTFALLLIRPVRSCPACFQGTAPVRKRWLAFLTRRMEWRWCASCGWEGLARRVGPDLLRAPPGAYSPSGSGRDSSRGDG